MIERMLASWDWASTILLEDQTLGANSLVLVNCELLNESNTILTDKGLPTLYVGHG